MGSFLMMRVLGVVRERLGRGKASNHQNTEDEETGEGTLKPTVRHDQHSLRTGGPMVLEPDRRSQDRPAAGAAIFLIGFTKTFRYTALTTA